MSMLQKEFVPYRRHFWCDFSYKFAAICLVNRLTTCGLPFSFYVLAADHWCNWKNFAAALSVNPDIAEFKYTQGKKSSATSFAVL